MMSTKLKNKKYVFYPAQLIKCSNCLDFWKLVSTDKFMPKRLEWQVYFYFTVYTTCRRHHTMSLISY